MYRNVTQLYFCMFFSPAFTDHDRPNYILSIPFSSLVMRWVGCRICMKFFNVWIACFVQTLTKGQSDELNITPPPPQNKCTATLRCSAVRITWKTVTRRTKDLTSRGLLLPPIASNRVSHNAKGRQQKHPPPPQKLTIDAQTHSDETVS